VNLDNIFEVLIRERVIECFLFYALLYQLHAFIKICKVFSSTHRHTRVGSGEC